MSDRSVGSSRFMREVQSLKGEKRRTATTKGVRGEKNSPKKKEGGKKRKVAAEEKAVVAAEEGGEGNNILVRLFRYRDVATMMLSQLTSREISRLRAVCQDWKRDVTNYVLEKPRIEETSFVGEMTVPDRRNPDFTATASFYCRRTDDGRKAQTMNQLIDRCISCVKRCVAKTENVGDYDDFRNESFLLDGLWGSTYWHFIHLQLPEMSVQRIKEDLKNGGRFYNCEGDGEEVDVVDLQIDRCPSEGWDFANQVWRAARKIRSALVDQNSQEFDREFDACMQQIQMFLWEDTSPSRRIIFTRSRIQLQFEIQVKLELTDNSGRSLSFQAEIFGDK